MFQELMPLLSQRVLTLSRATDEEAQRPGPRWHVGGLIRR
jgi:hypothetical protein